MAKKNTNTKPAEDVSELTTEPIAEPIVEQKDFSKEIESFRDELRRSNIDRSSIGDLILKHFGDVSCVPVFTNSNQFKLNIEGVILEEGFVTSEL